jgi:hypothetical protein
MISIKKRFIPVIALGLLASTPAFAMSDYCWIAGQKVGFDTCGPIPANRSGHFIHYAVSSFLNYWVQDIHTKVYIRTGSSGWRGKRETVFGLYGWYTLRIKGFGGTGNLNNT